MTTATVPRTLRRLLDGKTDPQEFLSRLTMEELCALGAPKVARFTTFFEDSFQVQYEVPRARLTPSQVRELSIIRRNLGREPKINELPQDYLTFTPHNLDTVAANAKRLVTLVQAGQRIMEGKWQIIKAACERIDN